MPVHRMLPAAVLLLGLLAPLAAAAQPAGGKATGGPAAAPLLMEEDLFVLEGGPVDLTPTPEELAAQALAPPPAPTASAAAPAALAAYPNPAPERATVRFTLDAPAAVRLAVYDLLGREVAVLADGALEAGTHEAAFDGSGLPSGVYLVRLEAGGAVHTQRLTLLR